MNETHQSATPAAEYPRAERTAPRVGAARAATSASSSAMADAWDEARSRRLHRSPYPRAVGALLRQAARVQVGAWDRALRDVRRVQERQLLSLLEHAKDTEFGRAHGFSRIRSYDDFARQVPVGDYDSHSPFIDRMRTGETNLLVPEFVRYFGNSSGSSNHGRPKFLPITNRQIRHQQRAGTDTVMRYLHWSGDEGMFGGGYTLGLFPAITMREEGPVLITSNPALMNTKMPAITRPCYLPEDDVKRIADYEAKLGVIAERYFDHDIHAVTGTTCWFTLLFEKVLAEAGRRGRGARSVREVWPNLRVLIGGGVSAEPYLPVIRQLVGREDVTLVDTYNATEGGLYASSDFSGARGMLVLPHRGTFFEFIPLEEHGSPSARRVPLWAVERDTPYVIVPTTVSGLYAYTLGDIVRFPQTAPLRMEFMGRLSGCLSVTQELTTHVEIERAVADALRETRCTTVDFGAAADVGVDGTAKSRYLLFVEFQDGGAPGDLDAFTAAFDRGLCGQNRVYREHRSGDVAILAPRVVPLRAGGARRFLEEFTRGNVQGKFPRIIDDTKKALLWKHAKGSP
ncbi:MAG: GH3 family domain-containing protein [Polyangiaceae bacterium]